MTIYQYFIESRCSYYFWVLLILHVSIILLGAWLIYKSVSTTDWNHPYTKSRLINYAISVVGSSSIITILTYPKYQQLLICALHLAGLILLSITYRQFRYDSERVLWRLNRIFHI